MNKRGFRCRVYEGCPDDGNCSEGEVKVWVDAELVQEKGDKAIRDAAWYEWHRQGSWTGVDLPTGVVILEEIKETNH